MLENVKQACFALDHWVARRGLLGVPRITLCARFCSCRLGAYTHGRVVALTGVATRLACSGVPAKRLPSCDASGPASTAGVRAWAAYNRCASTRHLEHSGAKTISGISERGDPVAA